MLTPWSKRVGVSRRIGSDRERRRLRDIVTRARPKDLGFIIRTAGEGTREADLEADVALPRRGLGGDPRRADRGARAGHALRGAVAAAARDPRLRERPHAADRDRRSRRSTRRCSASSSASSPTRSRASSSTRAACRSSISEGLEARIDENLGKKVWLKSGGYLIVDQSEALTAIDVNTGRYVGKRDLEETVLKTNLEAVQEVVHQLRFRNIGGLIIIDLIDMESAENRDKVYRALQEALRSDKARTNILKISELGLVEMTRKRTRENLVQQLCEPCSFCEGRGYVLSAETVAYKLLREIRKDLPRFGGRQIAVSVSPRVGEMLQGPARRALSALSEQLGREIEVRTRPGPAPGAVRGRGARSGSVGGDPGAVAREPRGARGGRGGAPRRRGSRRAAAERRPTRRPRPRRPRAARRAGVAEPHAIEAPRRGARRSPAPAARGTAARRPRREPHAEPPGPVDGEGEDSILPRLQNSEDS